VSKSEDHNEQVIRWINGEVTPEERQQIESTIDFKKYQAILNEVDTWTVDPLDVDHSYEKLRQKMSGGAKVIPIYKTMGFRMAAAFLVLAVSFLYFFVFDSSMVTYETGLAETQEITLPDGSTVNMGASSMLSYDESEWKRKRSIKLEGTGFFEVTKGKPFDVDFGLGTTVVHGTAFEIKGYENFASVMCYEGEVSVKTADTSTFLKQGDGVKVTDKESEAFKFENLTWSRKVTRFYRTPLSVVFNSLESQFELKINQANIDNKQTFTGAYLNSDADAALKMVCDPMKISYKKEGNSVTLE